MDRDPNKVSSSLSGIVLEDGVTVQLAIYRLEHESQWSLEVINDAGTSIVWDVPFDTDVEAHAAFRLTVDEEGMDAFLDRSNVIQFPRCH
jgi:hypothetical protein